MDPIRKRAKRQDEPPNNIRLKTVYLCMCMVKYSYSANIKTIRKRNQKMNNKITSAKLTHNKANRLNLIKGTKIHNI